jgi:hypothetical protein
MMVSTVFDRGKDILMLCTHKSHFSTIPIPLRAIISRSVIVGCGEEVQRKCSR